MFNFLRIQRLTWIVSQHGRKSSYNLIHKLNVGKFIRPVWHKWLKTENIIKQMTGLNVVPMKAVCFATELWSSWQSVRRFCSVFYFRHPLYFVYFKAQVHEGIPTVGWLNICMGLLPVAVCLYQMPHNTHWHSQIVYKPSPWKHRPCTMSDKPPKVGNIFSTLAQCAQGWNACVIWVSYDFIYKQMPRSLDTAIAEFWKPHKCGKRLTSSAAENLVNI